MRILKTDSLKMPGEFEGHKGTLMIWPVRPGSWTNKGKEAKKVFTEIARKIAEHEELYMLAYDGYVDEAAAALDADEIVYAQGDVKVLKTPSKFKISVLAIKTDDAWARDVCPTFVRNDDGNICGTGWCFNAWGGSFDGLYADYENDAKAAFNVCEYLDIDFKDARDFVLEGGSIHSDGEGTLLVTESCLLSKGRNPELSKQQIEDRLKKELGVSKVIWLPYGIYNDETNEHVDNVCAFVRPAEVLLAWTDDKSDPQYAMSAADLEVLENETDAKGRKIKVHLLHIPEKHVCITEEELNSLEAEPGEDEREYGERLAASYVNFYIANGLIVYPRFGDVNDDRAQRILEECFPDREVYGIDARPIIVGGGNIHCITQQIPEVRL